MNKYFKTAMFITSFIPLWVSVVFIDMMSLVQGTANPWSEVVGMGLIVFSLLSSIIIIAVSLRRIDKSEYQDYKLLDVSQQKGITSEFLLSYILPLFVFDFTQWTGCVLFIIYYGVLSFLCIRNNNVYANLILEVLKYRFYSCKLQWTTERETIPFQTIVISKENLCAKQGHTISAAMLNKPFFISEASLD